ncbi:MAG TPA: type I polyketide synthase [Blastocatellia bacterium]|nr:type I polyketide synthase [Blastocatellia bacterium]
MTPAIAIVGMACLYPDAHSPVELWENALAQRRAFRQIPPERLRVEDYLSEDRNGTDSIYPIEAAVIEGYEFDRVGFRVAGSTFRSADLAHWLALDIAAKALADAGFDEEDLPREATGVVLGNTLTGEFSRAGIMRLRWPYVRRVLEPALIKNGWSQQEREQFLGELEASYKKPFPAVGEESLAGGLSNTIAGRICNHFDLKGGGYTVDAACASSLLAVTTACSSLASGDLDLALAGGVDLSLDPFELVGFAKTSALTPGEMRVYDSRSNGFWPGEGCGFVVLMRHEDAVAQNRQIYALIRGWGVSSDGKGGITRPEVEGQALALKRAYQRASFGIDTVTYFEGHGTGTSVGDTTELRALSRARREAAPDAPPAFISSIKANIGHTKAAAGIAGLIKATMALHTRILPPATACGEPHPELTSGSAALRVLKEGKSWPANLPLRAGVSAMGFGGINTHIALEKFSAEGRKSLNARERAVISSAQDSEIFLLGARNTSDLLKQVEHLQTIAHRLSRAEMSDLASALERSVNRPRLRAAVIASTPLDLSARLEMLKGWLDAGTESQINARAGVFLGRPTSSPRIGYLFPGQGSPAHLNGGALRRRFDFIRQLYRKMNFSEEEDSISTRVAQPAIITASLAGLRALDRLGIRAKVAVGHSLGELAALHWAGGCDEETLLRIATARGKAMSELGSATGAMASIRAGRDEVESLMNGDAAVIAGLNSPTQTVISGESSAIAVIIERARAKGIAAIKLPVSHAFHSPLVQAAAPVFADYLSKEEFHPLRGTVVSTITGARLEPDAELKELLNRQITSAVRFQEAITLASGETDLLLEVGPGETLAGLASQLTDVPVISLDAGGPSLKGFLKAAAAAFVMGAEVNHSAIFEDRFTRPFSLDWQPKFFTNPCELAPLPLNGHKESSPALTLENQYDSIEEESRPSAEDQANAPAVESTSASIIGLVRRLVAERAELPESVVKEDNRLLSDLHLNSITVTQIVTEVAQRMGLRRPFSPTDYADATVGEVAQALSALSSEDDSPELIDDDRLPTGIDSWVRTFTVEMRETPLARAPRSGAAGELKIIAPPDHPFARLLEQRREGWAGCSAVVVCLPQEADERHVDLLLEGAGAALEQPDSTKFVLVQHGGGAAAFAKSLHLENPGLTTCVVDVPAQAAFVDRVLAEIESAAGYSEAHYDEAGVRRAPVLRFLDLGEQRIEMPLGPSDVLLVTGGGKGITAECALSIARATGASLMLCGLSKADADEELSINLARIKAEGIPFKYFSADVTDADAMRAAISEAEASLGPVTGIIHGAAVNAPQLVRSMSREQFLKTLATKVQGARNVLAAVDTSRLKTFIAFSSIIGRGGLAGESHYAVANEWLTRLTEGLKQERPECRCIAIEWSVWSGVGMAQRIGGIDRLVQAGITPITPEEGVAILKRLLTSELPSVPVVVTGRYGDLPTLKVEQPDLPLLRFLENPRAFYPGIELIADSHISSDTDQYLSDHAFQGQKLLPAVMGLEAMAQAAMALVGATRPPLFEDVKFARPVIVPEGQSLVIRVAALVRETGRVEVVLRSRETAFQVDHFRAICSFAQDSSRSEEALRLFDGEIHSPLLPLDPEQDLYGGILFHKGRFRRLRGYRQLRAKECLAEISQNENGHWFGRYLPAKLLLGDPAARDTAIHAIQACIPHATVLPVGVDRLITDAKETSDLRFVHACERAREGDTFTYDIEVSAGDGVVIEKWEGLKLRIVSNGAAHAALAETLVGPYIERRVGELIPGAEVSIAVERDTGTERHERSNRAIHRALGQTIPIIRRFDGKPEVKGEFGVSATHCGKLTLAMAAHGELACDVERVVERPVSVWRSLLGAPRFKLAEIIVRDSGDDLDAAATRVWTAAECLKKAGISVAAPLVLASSTPDRWVLLSSGSFTVATHIGSVRGDESMLAMAVLLRRNDAIL